MQQRPAWLCVATALTAVAVNRPLGVRLEHDGAEALRRRDLPLQLTTPAICANHSNDYDCLNNVSNSRGGGWHHGGGGGSPQMQPAAGATRSKA